MDRYYNSISTGKISFLDINKFTASSVIQKFGIKGMHEKVLERTLLEKSGLPINNQLYLRWSERHLFEGVIEHLDWSNIGISTCLKIQGKNGRTPLIKALPMYDMRCLWSMKLDQLNKEVISFKTRLRKDNTGMADDDFIRFYPSPVADLNYLGVIIMCETHMFDLEKVPRMPYVIDIGSNYPRYIHNGPFLSVQVTSKNQKLILHQGEDRFNSLLYKAERLVREYGKEIYTLAKNCDADVIILEIESVSPDWFRVFDFDHIPLSERAKIHANIQS